jgi:uncharacterized protein YjbI with pentapeptide repeats
VLIGFIASLAAQGTFPVAQATLQGSSCLSTLRSVDAGEPLSYPALDGKLLKSASQISKLRKEAKDGRTLIIDGGNFAGQSFKGSFPNICFRGANLSRTKWTKASAPGVGFISSDLSGARMERATLNNVLFRNATLAGVKARAANLSNGQLDGGWDASMERLDLTNATLKGFRFICGETSADGCAFNRRGMLLENADLSQAGIHSFGLMSDALKGAVVNQTEIGLDHIAQLSSVRIAGPIIVRSANESAQLNAGQFDRLRAAVLSPSAAPANCTRPEGRMRELICASGKNDLAEMERENSRLYATIVPGAAAISPAQQDFLLNLSACSQQEDSQARECMKVEYEARREALINQLIARKPLPAKETALYVAEDVPFLRIALTHSAVQPIAPVLADTARAYLLVRTDEAGNQDSVAVGTDDKGNRCTAAHMRSAARTGAPRRGLSARVWSTGADFTTFATSQTASVRYVNACMAELTSGPLVRIPVNVEDFESLMAAATQTAGKP